MAVEESNYIKSYILIVKYAKEAVQTFFQTKIPESKLTAELLNSKTKIVKYLNRGDVARLFPNDGKNVSLDDLDISLLISILRHSGVMQISSKPCHWDKCPNYVTSEVEAMATIKHFRNFLAHAGQVRLSTPDYNELQHKVLDAILKLAGNDLYMAAKTVREGSVDVTEHRKSAELWCMAVSQDSKLDQIKQELTNVTKAIDARQSIINTSKEILENPRIGGKFVQTAALNDGMKMLDEKGILIYLGGAGDGKSTNAEVILSKKIMEEDCEVMKLHPKELANWKQLVDSDKTKYVLLDDILGKHNASEEIFRAHEICHFFEDVMNLVARPNGSVKVIMCVRKSIYRERLQFLSSYEIFSEKYCIDLTTEQYKLTPEEKISILQKHLECSEDIEITISDKPTEENICTDAILGTCPVIIAYWTLHKIATESKDYEGYPLSCRHFASERKLLRLGIAYFSYPRKYLIDNLNQMRDATQSSFVDAFNEQLKYCTLVYVMLQRNYLHCDKVDLEVFQEIVESLGFDRNLKGVKESGIKKAARELNGKYLYMDPNNVYRFQHDTVAEAVIFSYGDVCQKAILDQLEYRVLFEVVRTEAYKSARDEVCLSIRSSFYENLADRFIMEMRKNNGLTVAGHSAMDDKGFVEVFMRKVAEAREKEEFVSENGESVNETLFTGACYFQRLAFAEYLLYNANVPLPLSLFATVYSCHSGYTKQADAFFKYLSRKGGQFKALQRTVHLKGLFAACESGHEGTVKLILGILEKPNPEDFVEAFHTACSHGKLTIAKLLTTRTQTQTERSCLTPEHLGKALVAAASNGCTEIVQWLLKDNSDIPEEYVVKAFKRACMFQCEEVTNEIRALMWGNGTLCEYLNKLYMACLVHRRTNRRLQRC